MRPLEHLRLLLVEDNPDDVLLLRALLAKAGVAPSALEVRETLAGGLGALTEPIDLLFLDLSLPDAKGMEGIQRILATTREVPIVVLTGLDDEAVADQMVQAGAQDYLVKGDLDARSLRRTIRHARERHRLAQEVDRARQDAAFRATHDTLTGLPNRALFLDRLEHAFARARRQDTGLAVCFIDLNHFKSVNDIHGHAVGDAFLVAVADRLRRVVRQSDTLARLGGDEFVVLFEDLAPHADPERVAESIAERAAGPVQIDGALLDISLSHGVAIFRRDADSPETLLAAADARMYAAKRRSRQAA